MLILCLFEVNYFNKLYHIWITRLKHVQSISPCKIGDWISLDKTGQKWTKMDKNGKVWTSMDKYGHCVFKSNHEKT